MKQRKNNDRKDEIVVHIGQQFPLTIKKIGINGEGIGYFKRKIVFVEGALPGEVVTVEATEVQEKIIIGRICKIRKRSVIRQKPLCTHYKKCGGCQLQHAKYGAQQAFKHQIVLDALKKYAHLSEDDVCVFLPLMMKHPFQYRNKSQLKFGEKDGQAVLGLYEKDSHQLVELSDCPIHMDRINKINRTVIKIIRKYQIPVYKERTKKGILKNLVVRVSTTHPEVQVTFVATTKEIPNIQKMAYELMSQHPQVKGVFVNVNVQNTPLVFGTQTIKIAGRDTITQKLGDLVFDLSPRSFFQLNPIQTEVLYDVVRDFAGLTGKENVVDAYCGVGTIGLYLSAAAKEVRGMDTVEEAIVDAKKNAKKNGCRRVSYFHGTAKKWVSQWKREGWTMDVFVVDPPRIGCDRELLDTILSSGAKRVVYVSCNPSTMARDIQTLREKYIVQKIQPVDLFPMSGHVETVVLLSKGEVDSKKIRVEFSLEDMDMSGFQKGATYEQIKAYVLEKFGLKVSSLYISQIKRKCGLDVGQNYNLSKKEDAKVPQCPPEKEAAIMEALKHFQMT
ncbi:MAG TPA: 23S rRNA (uracil(1939)-C(5))-methyltransferase RlmD [Firmicutes bacterium]|nr:23S rRNA (uracil(1939)-C(5))-methyltransferase RlmD [Bacillota bacterium]